MADIAILLAPLPDTLRAQLATAFLSNGIEDAADVSCLLGSDQYAEGVAKELLGDSADEQVTTYLRQIWKASQKVGKAQLCVRASRRASKTIPATIQPQSNIFQKRYDASATLLLKTTVAAVRGCRAVPIVHTSAAGSTGALSSKNDLAAEWLKVLTK